MLEQLAPGKEHVVLGKDLDATLRGAAATAPCVLASGDPGFFGIVRALSGADRPTATSTPRRPRSRSRSRGSGVPWDDALVVSAHGRDPHAAINAALRHPKVAILTQPGNTELIVDALAARRPVVAEALGTPDERLATEPPFNDPNVVIVHEPTAGRATVWPPRTPTRWALPEDAFEHRAGMITKAEVRALALAALGPGTGDHVWDVGCGSGAVAIECARLGAAVTAIDQDPDAIALADPQRRRARRPARHRRSAPRPSRCATSASPTPSSSAAAAPPSSTRRREPRRAVVVTLALIDRIAPTIERLVARVRRDRDDAAGQPREAARRRPPPRRREPGDRDRGAPMKCLGRRGVGCSLGCPPEELRALIEATLPARRAASRSRPSIAARRSRACSPRPSTSASRCTPTPPRRSPRSTCPTPSAVVARHVGTPSVAEAAALLSGTRLLVPKTRSEHATCAVAECPE